MAELDSGDKAEVKRPLGRRVWAGGLMMAAGLIVLFLPVVQVPGFGVVTVAQARGICSGTLAPAVPIPSGAVCAGPAVAYVLATAIFLLGVALLSWGIAKPHRD